RTCSHDLNNNLLSPLVALTRHGDRAQRCLLLGVKRTSHLAASSSADRGHGTRTFVNASSIGMRVREGPLAWPYWGDLARLHGCIGACSSIGPVFVRMRS